jgi:ADP-ribosylglycohydrolase
VEIKDMLQNTFEYDLNFSLDEIRPSYRFNEICQDTVPQAIVAFLESSDYEDAIRNAISLGGDSDTLACITGGIAAAYFGGIPEEIRRYACGLLTEEFLELLIQTESF